MNPVEQKIANAAAKGVGGAARTTGRALLSNIGQDSIKLASRSAAETSKSLPTRIADFLRNLPSFIGQFFRFILGEGEQAGKKAAAETAERTGEKFADAEAESETIANLRKQLAEAQEKNEASEVETTVKFAENKAEAVLSETDEIMARINQTKGPELGLHQDSVESLTKTIKELSNGQMTDAMARENADAILANTKWVFRTGGQDNKEVETLLDNLSRKFADEKTPAEYRAAIEKQIVQLLYEELEELKSLADSATGGVSALVQQGREIIAAKLEKNSGSKVKKEEVLRLFNINDILANETEKAKLSTKQLRLLENEHQSILTDLERAGTTPEEVTKKADGVAERLKQAASGTGVDHAGIKEEALETAIDVMVDEFEVLMPSDKYLPSDFATRFKSYVKTEMALKNDPTLLNNELKRTTHNTAKLRLEKDLKAIQGTLPEHLAKITEKASIFEKELLKEVQGGVSAVDEAYLDAVSEEISSALVQAVKGDDKITRPERGMTAELVKDFLKYHHEGVSDPDAQDAFQMLKNRIASFKFDPDKLAKAAFERIEELKDPLPHYQKKMAEVKALAAKLQNKA
jgi:predicted DNA-binding protein